MLQRTVRLFLLAFPFLVSCKDSDPLLHNQFDLQPHMIINETGCGYGTNVADEQHAATPSTLWQGHDKEHCKEYRPSLVLSFGQVIGLTAFQMYATEIVQLEISGAATPVITAAPLTVSLVKGWNKIPFIKEAAYVRIKLTKGSSLAEIRVETSKNLQPVKVPIPQAKAPRMREFIGTNAFVDVPLGLLEPFGAVREYHDWPDWNEPQKDKISLNTSENGFEFRKFYTDMDKLGKVTVPVIQKSPKWLTGMDNVQSKPLAKGSKRDNPLSYGRHAYFMSRYASHFSQKANGNIHYFENWNEPDKWWEYDVSYFTPYQYAAMSSADLDGHLHTLPGQSGINTGSELVMAGLANPKIDYLNALHYWSSLYRKGQFPFKVINYHFYANKCGLPDNQATEGISPESSDLYKKAKEIVDFRNRFAPASQVWITEFGYDTENSPQQCKPVKDKNSEQVQADWLLRSYLLLSASGVDKAFQFMIRDFDKQGLYATSGLYSSFVKPEPFLRPSFHYISTLSAVLGSSSFRGIEVDSSEQLYKATYASTEDPSLRSEVVWYGTSEGKVNNNYKVTVPSGHIARVTEFDQNETCGRQRVLQAGATISISETPVIVQFHPQGKFGNCHFLRIVNPSEMISTDHYGALNTLLLDEQQAGDNPAIGLDKREFTRTWQSSYNNKVNEAIILDLKTNKNIHSVYLYDGASEGEVAVSIKTEQGWTEVGRLSMDLYNKWKPCVINNTIQLIKIEKVKGKFDIGEAIVYEIAEK